MTLSFHPMDSNSPTLPTTEGEIIGYTFAMSASQNKTYTVETSKDLVIWEPIEGASGIGFESVALGNATIVRDCYFRVRME